MQQTKWFRNIYWAYKLKIERTGYYVTFSFCQRSDFTVLVFESEIKLQFFRFCTFQTSICLQINLKKEKE